MGTIAVEAAKSIGYVNAGTFEFLVDPKENFYFLEMNTRLQVEHPVTEEITGVDLVAEQLRIAEGHLAIAPEDLAIRGHAIECRIYAEDPYQNYIPSPGHVHSLRFPAGPGVRVDSGVAAGGDVSEFYDPMVAKIIVWGQDCSIAIARMRRALQETHVGGIRTNTEFLEEILTHPQFVEGGYDTGLLGGWDPVAQVPDELEQVFALVAAVEANQQQVSGNTAEPESKGTGSLWKAEARRRAVQGGGR